jgi:hypothetical protein
VENNEMNISVEEIYKAISEIKLGKSEGCSALLSDHIKHGTHRLFVIMSLLFTCMITHGYSPTKFTEACIVPIPKSNKKS